MSETLQQLPVAVRLSVTDRCRMRCRYCMEPAGVTKAPRESILSFDEIAAFVRAVGTGYNIGKVHITGGEALEREGLAELVSRLAAEGAGEIVLTTNGQLLRRHALALRRAGLSRVNISLDSLNDATYRWLTRGGDLDCTLDAITAAREAGFSPVKINMTVLRGVNSREVCEMAAFAISAGVTARFIELMPIGPARARHAEWFVPSSKVFAALSRRFEITAEPTRPGASAREFSIHDVMGRRGRIGFISSLSAPFCAGCRRLRLSARGDLIGCLALGGGTNVRRLISAGDNGARRIVKHVAKALVAKRSGSRFRTAKGMAEVGG